MALEYRPLPELKGQDAIYFWETVANFKATKSPEEIRELNRWARESFEEAIKRDRGEL